MCLQVYLRRGSPNAILGLKRAHEMPISRPLVWSSPRRMDALLLDGAILYE
jgi:hypothetical protein